MIREVLVAHTLKKGSGSHMIIRGGYKKYEDRCEAEAKEILKNELHNLIDELCERDDFWIKTERDRTGEDILRQENTIGWKITIPHMEDK